jgi:hypothetical protein
MKTTKLLAILFLLCAFSAGTFSQSILLRGGMNLGNAQITDAGSDDISTQSFTGYQFGILGEIGSEIVALETGVLFSNKGVKTDGSYFFDLVQVDQQYSLNYLEVPIHAKVSFGPENFKIFASAGPYIGFGLNGKAKYETEVGGVTEEETEDIEFGSDEDEDDLKRFDYGLNVSAGIEIDRFQLGATYGYGLANLAIDPEDDERFSNRVLQIHLSYKIIDR